MQLPLTLSLRPSRRLAFLLTLAHLFAVASLFVTNRPLLPLPVPGILVLAFFVFASFVWTLSGLFGRRRYVRLSLQRDGTLDYALKNGETGSARVDPQSTLMPWLLILLLRRREGDVPGRLSSLVLLPDTLSGEDFRQLRLWLRWQVVFSAGKTPQ